MRRVPFAEIPATAWNEAVAASGEAWAFHRSEWVAIEAEASDVTNHGFGLVDATGVVQGIFPLYAQPLALGPFVENLLHCGVHRHTGAAVRSDLPEDTRAGVQSELRKALFELAAEVDADRIQLNANNLAPDRLRSDRSGLPPFIDYDGFHLGLGMGPMGLRPAPGVSTLYADQIVELSGRRREDLFAALDGSCRRAVRKAEKNQLAFEVVEGPSAPEAAARYLALARRSAARTGETLAPDAYYEAVLGLPDGIGQLVVARHENRDVAALLLVVFKEAVHFLAGCSDPEALSVRPNDFVHWSAIEWAWSRGYEAYRLGPAFPELPPEWPVAKVTRFKTKLGGTPTPVLQGSCFLRPERYVELATQHARDLSGMDPAVPDRPPSGLLGGFRRAVRAWRAP